MPDPLKKKVRILHTPFNYEWPDGRVSVVREPGEHELDTVIANAALEAGAAIPCDVEKPKAKRATRRKPAIPKTDEQAADTDTNGPDAVGRESLAADGGADDEPPAADTE